MEVTLSPAQWPGAGWHDTDSGELWVVKRSEEKQSIGAKVHIHPLRLVMDRPPSGENPTGTPHRRSSGFFEGDFVE